MDVCIALGLLTSELCEEPWKGNVISFSKNPKILKVTGTSLAEKYRAMMSMDFQAIFDQILALVVRNKLPKEKTIKRWFVFTDMEFDQARHEFRSYSCSESDT